MGTTQDLDLEPATAEKIVRAALAKQLFTEAEVDAARSSAEETGKSVVAVLVEEGLIAPRTVDALAASLAESDAQDSALTRANGGPASAVKAPPSAPVVAGYELLSKLGEGGMGAVWRARQLKVGGREVALKVISGGSAVSDDAKARFMREAGAAAAVSHENVISIFDVGETADGRPFMALELVPGGDAQKLCETRGGRLHEAEALALVRDAARGVGALAKAGLVHRDIKPANIFIGADRRAKLADLGLARQAAGDDRMTASGMIVGTPAFMSPEQASAQPLDVRTDIYALGATLYALCTGRPPFVGRTALVVVAKVLNDEAPDPRDLAPALSAGTARVIARALSKDPRARFQTADELVDALQRALAAISGRAPREVPPPRPSGRVIAKSPQTVPLPASGQLASGPRSVAVPAVLGLCLFGFLGAGLVARGRRTPAAPTPPRVAQRPSVTPSAPAQDAPAQGEAVDDASPGARLPDDTWTPPPAPRATSGGATSLPTTGRRTGYRAQPLDQGTSTLGAVRGDPLGRVIGTNTRYMTANSRAVEATDGVAGLHLERAPDAVWWSVRVNPSRASGMAAIGDSTGTHAFAAQVRLDGGAGELLVWLLDPRRSTSPNDFGLARETPVARLPLRGVNRSRGANLQLFFSLTDRWAVSLTQDDRSLAQDQGPLPDAASAELARGLRVFTAVCAHEYDKDRQPLEAGLLLETR
jgi:serine/threonine protein kinase